MKKRRIIIPILACLLLLSGILGWRVMSSYSRVIQANWGISLPLKALISEVYEADSGASFHGDGVRYHVFSYKYEDYIDLMFAWSGTEHETHFYSSVSEAADAWLDEIQVPDAKRPNYPDCFSWHRSKEDHSEIIFFWDNDLNRLYIIENLF